MKRTPMRALADAAGRLAATLAERGPLAGIAPDTVAAFLELGDLVELDAGEALIREGEPAMAEIYLLVDGALIVQSKGARLARLERPGDVVGEAAVVLGSKRTADVLAEGAARVVAVPGKALALPEFTDVAAGVRSALLRDDWVQY
jgi:CRP-like cAMP-binding protein